MNARLCGWCVVLASTSLAACGRELLTAPFTSRIVQLETCRTVGEGAEGCSRTEQFAERDLDLVEVEPDVLWLYGVSRDGVANRAIIGTRDTVGGFLFIDERTQTNTASTCTIVTRTELSLKIEPGREADVGSDPCIALVGRSVDTTASSSGCDSAGVPPQAIVQTVRRRYEALDAASTCGQ